MTVTRSLLFLLAAIVLAVIALLVAAAVLSTGNWQEWVTGSLIAYYVSLLP